MRLGMSGLCALVLGLVTMTSSGTAQAEVGANWGYLNQAGELKFFNKALVPQLQIREIENNTATLLFSFGSTPVTVLCTSAALIEGGKLELEGTISLGRVAFSGCVMLVNGKFIAACQPIGGGKKGVIESKKATALLVLHELAGKTHEPLVLIKPDTGTTLAEIEFSEECALGPGWPIAGQLALRDGKNELKTHLVEHLLLAGPLTALTFVGSPAVLDGSVLVKLFGFHEFLKWAGSPA